MGSILDKITEIEEDLKDKIQVEESKQSPNSELIAKLRGQLAPFNLPALPPKLPYANRLH